mgnify:CR=1 FL=1
MKLFSFNTFVVIAVILIFAGFLVLRNKPADTSMMAPQLPAQQNGQDPSQVSQQVEIQPEQTPIDRNNYQNYSDATLLQTQKTGTTLLFFAATTWCQTCSALEEEILQRHNELPADVTILKVDYDNDPSMKKKWAVTTQHTLVALDQDGQELKRWVGGNFDVLLQELKGL